MKPITNGFCAFAAPARPRAAAPAAPPSRPRRPIVNLSIIALPPRSARPEWPPRNGQQAVCQRLETDFLSKINQLRRSLGSSSVKLYAISSDCILFGHGSCFKFSREEAQRDDAGWQPNSGGKA